jgi:hypothetical protein
MAERAVRHGFAAWMPRGVRMRRARALEGRRIPSVTLEASMRQVAAAALLLAFASTSHAQSAAAPEPCAASLERVLAGGSPDWSGNRCDHELLSAVTQRVRAAAQVSDSARLDRLAGAAARFRHPELFRAALAVARDRRAPWRARALGLELAFGQVRPYLIVQAREPGPAPPPQCGSDADGRVVCTVSSGPPECLIGVAKRAGFAGDRPIPARLHRELRSLIDTVRDDGRAPTELRRVARCIDQAWG